MHLIMSIRTNPTFIQLLEIRESLFDLLDRKLRESCAEFTTPQLDQSIRTRIQHLENNALYLAGSLDSFRRDINKRLSKMSRWHQDRYRQDRNDCVREIRGEISFLVEIIEFEVMTRGSLAMLGELSLAPFLEEEEKDQ